MSLGASQTFGALTNATAVAHTGLVTLNGSTLTIGVANNLSSTFGAVIADGAAAGTLNKAGGGTFTLTGANTYSTTTISAGVLQVGAAGTTGTLGTVRRHQQRRAGLQPQQHDHGRQRHRRQRCPDAGRAHLVLSAANSYAGGTAIQAGVVKLGIANALPTGTTVTLGSAAANGALDLAGFPQQVGGLAVAAAVPARAVASQLVGSSSTTANSILTFAGGTSSFGGTLQNTLAGGTRKLALNVTAGALTLTGSTYTGNTTVNGGRLLVSNASGSGTSTGINSVGSGTLGGTGTTSTTGNVACCCRRRRGGHRRRRRGDQDSWHAHDRQPRAGDRRHPQR